MRVLGDEAIADPSTVERKVRRTRLRPRGRCVRQAAGGTAAKGARAAQRGATLAGGRAEAEEEAEVVPGRQERGFGHGLVASKDGGDGANDAGARVSEAVLQAAGAGLQAQRPGQQEARASALWTSLAARSDIC